MGDHDDDDDDDRDDRRGRAPRLTFPLPKEEILKGQVRAIGQSPVTVGVGVAAVLLAPVTLGVASLGLLAGLGWYWKRRMPELEEEVIADLVEERNAAQDKDLNRSAKTLRRYKRYDDANRLRRFIAMKRDIEEAMHACPKLDGDEVKLEHLVDTLCFEVRDELFRIADLHYALKKRRKRISSEKEASMKESIAQLDARVGEAYETLKAARANLEGLVGVEAPAKGGSETNPVLDGAIAKLREETELARRVRERIEADMAAELAPWELSESGVVADSGTALRE